MRTKHSKHHLHKLLEERNGNIKGHWKRKGNIVGPVLCYFGSSWFSFLFPGGFFKSHRILEYAELVGTHQDHWIQLLALCRTLQKSHHVLRELPKCFFNSVHLGAVTSSLGSCSSALVSELIQSRFKFTFGLLQIAICKWVVNVWSVSICMYVREKVYA